MFIIHCYYVEFMSTFYNFQGAKCHCHARNTCQIDNEMLVSLLTQNLILQHKQTEEQT